MLESSHSTTAGERAPRVAVIVLSWNAWRETIGCLEALQRLDYPEFQLIVVDNGSRDGSLARLESWAHGEHAAGVPIVVGECAGAPVRCATYTGAQAERGGEDEREAWLEEAPPARRLVVIASASNLGFAAGNNLGLRYALARGFGYVMLLNNDVVVEPETLTRLVSSLEEHPPWAGVAPKVVSRRHPERLLYAGGAIRLAQAKAFHRGRGARDGPSWTGVRPTAHLSGCAALYRASFLREAGLLDEDFFFGQEDVALSCCARALAAPLGVNLDARVHHDEGHSLASRPELSVYYYNKYRLLLLRKHGSPAQICLGFAFLTLSRLLKFPFALLRGRPSLIRAEARAYIDFLAGRLGDYDRQRARRP